MEQLIYIPTRVTSKTATLIDHVLINSSQKVSQYGVIELDIYDHDLVYYTRKTASAIHRRDKLLKKYKNSGLETDKDHLRSAKMTLQKAISKKKKFFFQEKIDKNVNNSKELWKAFKSRN